MGLRKTSKPMFSSIKIGQAMTVAKVIELTAASSKSIEDAIETGIKRADSTLDQIEGAWVQDIKCVVKNGKVSEWRVNLKVTFLLK
jgi:flavin-binding protein dodecin